MAPSLRRNFVWAFVGTATLAASQFVLMTAVVKLAADGAGAERLGDWTLANTITGPVFVFFLFKLRVVLTTDMGGEHGWPAYAATRLWAMVAGLLVTGAVVAVGYHEVVGVTIMAAALMKAFEGGSDIIYGYLQHRERLDQVSRSQTARAVTTVAVGIAVLLVTDSVAAVMVSSAAVYGVAMGVDIVLTRRRLGLDPPSRDGAAIARAVRQYAPLGAVSAIGSLQINIPRWFLEHHATRAELGVFGTLHLGLSLGALVVNAIAYAALTRLAGHAAAREWPAFARTLRKLVLTGAALAGVTVLGAAVAGPTVLRLVLSDEFAAHGDLLVWMAATSGLVWMYLFFGTALDAMRRYRVQPYIHGVSTAVIALASWYLVPRHGMYGATWGMLIGFAVECLLYVVMVIVPLRAELRAHREGAAA